MVKTWFLFIQKNGESKLNHLWSFVADSLERKYLPQSIHPSIWLSVCMSVGIITGLDRCVRPGTSKKWKDSAKSKAASESISIDSAKLWNNAPEVIKNAITLRGAKREIKKYCKLLET